MAEAMGPHMASSALLLGRRTYEDFAAYWPTQDGPITRALEATDKYVASRTLQEPLPWANSHVLDEPVAALKRRRDLVIMGSGELIRSVFCLVDELLLMTHPLVLGTGRRLLPTARARDWS